MRYRDFEEELLERYEEAYEDVWDYILLKNPGLKKEELERWIEKIYAWDGDDDYKEKMKYFFNIDTEPGDEVYSILFKSMKEWIEDFCIY